MGRAMSTNGTPGEREKDAKPLALDYLLSIVRNEEADPTRRDKAAVAVASLGHAPREGGGNGAKPAAAAGPLTEEELLELAKGLMGWLGPILKDVETRLAVLEKRKGLASVAARIAELEAKPGLKYCGVWAAEKVYNVGDFVTDHGSLWHCWDGNVGVRPGSSDTWQLAVQRGRDAKGKGSR
jgi:hypothetical protein